MVMMILLMLVDSESDFLIFHRAQFYGERSRNAAQEIEFVLVHGDRVQCARQEIFQFDHFSLLRLNCFLMLNESFE